MTRKSKYKPGDLIIYIAEDTGMLGWRKYEILRIDEIKHNGYDGDDNLRPMYWISFMTPDVNFPNADRDSFDVDFIEDSRYFRLATPAEVVLFSSESKDKGDKQSG